MIPRGQWLRIMTRDNWTCQRCGRSLEEEGARPQVGHIVPASMGGKAVDSNLRAECGECNESAGNSTDGENKGRNWWRKSGGKIGGYFSLKEAVSLFQQSFCSYPVHIAEDAALREWRNAVVRYSDELDCSLGHAAELILAKIRLYALSDAGRTDGLREGWNPPYMATWLKNGQFKDDPNEWTNKRKRDVERITEGVAGPDDF